MQMPIAIKVYLQNCTALLSFSGPYAISGEILIP
jgi:hypothetical protein